MTGHRVGQETLACLELLLADSTVKSATKYVSACFVVKLTRKHKVDRRDRHEEFILTIGRPNYAERAFIKDCKAAGETFPVRKVQLKHYSKKAR